MKYPVSARLHIATTFRGGRSGAPTGRTVHHRVPGGQRGGEGQAQEPGSEVLAAAYAGE